MSFFELKYLAQASTSPVVSRLEKQGFKYVDLLESSQNVNKALYAGVDAINKLISSLPQVDSQLGMTARLHDSSYQLSSQLFKDFYLIGIDLVHCLSNEIERMIELERLKRISQETASFTAPNRFVMESRMKNNPEVNRAIEALMISQSRFRSLNNERLQKLNQLLGQLNNMLSIQRYLVKLLSARKNVLDYDNTINRSYINRVARNIARYEPVLSTAIQELNNYHVYLEEAKRRIMSSESEFRSLYHIDPSQYVLTNNVHNMRDLYGAYQKVSSALGKEIEQLKKEMHIHESRESKMKQNYQMSVNQRGAFLNAGLIRPNIMPFAQRNPLEGVFSSQLPSNLIVNHPRIVGLASQQKSLQSMIREQLMDVDMVVTEIRDCINRTDKDIGYCVSHLASVKKRDLTSIQRDINYIKTQQNLSRDKLRYSKILVALYKELSRVVREKEKMDISEQESAYKKNILSNIAKQIELKKSLEQSIRQLNDMRVAYAEMLDSDQSSVKRESKENLKAIESMIEQNQKLLSIVQREQENLPSFAEPLIKAQMAQGRADKRNEDVDDIRKRVRTLVRTPLGPYKTQLPGESVKENPGLLEQRVNVLRKSMGEQSGGASGGDLEKELRRALAENAGGLRNPEGMLGGLLEGGASNFLSSTALDVSSIEEAQNEVRNTIISVIKEELVHAGVLPSQLNEVQKLTLLISAEILYFETMAKKYGDLSSGGYNRLAENIANQYAITILVAMRSSYIEIRDALRKVVMRFRKMDEVLLNAYASALRTNVKFLPEGADTGRAELEKARQNLMEKIRVIESQLDKVDDLCNDDDLPTVGSVAQLGESELNSDTLDKLKKCGSEQDNLIKLLPEMTNAIASLNGALSRAYSDVLEKVITENLPADKISPYYISSFYAKARQLATEGAVELSILANKMMVMKRKYADNITGNNGVDNFLKTNCYYNNLQKIRDRTDNIGRLLEGLKSAFENAQSTNNDLRNKIQEVSNQKTPQNLLQLRFLAQDRNNKMNMLREIYYQIQDSIYQFSFNLTELFRKHYQFNAYLLEEYLTAMTQMVNHNYKLSDRLDRLRIMMNLVKNKILTGTDAETQMGKTQNFYVDQVEKYYKSIYEVYNGLIDELQKYPKKAEVSASVPSADNLTTSASGKIAQAYNELKNEVNKFMTEVAGLTDVEAVSLFVAKSQSLQEQGLPSS